MMAAAEEQNKPLLETSAAGGPTTTATTGVAAAAVAASTTAAAPPLMAYGASSEWATSLQAYYNSGGAASAVSAHAFFPPGASHHSYAVWAPQMVSPYGTHIPISPMYHPGPMYAHPSMGMNMPYPASEVEVRPIEGKIKGSTSKGSSGNARGSPEKSEDGRKGTSASADNASRSSEDGSEGSSDTREDNDEQKESTATKKRKYRGMAVDGETSQTATIAHCNNTIAESSYNARGRSVTKLPVSAPGRSALPNSSTNLNIGMDIWNTSHSATVNVKPNEVTAASAMVGRDGVMSEHQLDERELKRERRKQSNRESARRSRLRKQQECEELARRVAELNSENSALKVELEHLKKTCSELEAENSQIMEEMVQLHEPGINIDPSRMLRVSDSGSLARNNSNKSNGNFYNSSGNQESTSR
ncbi:DNA-binding protein EMBP-1-like isoform X2 [Ananas comosus]|uniref:DNA-binding protein EMBP-1-like isoform X2 n=1 Tax=Ananas comosus TaxID=4615 RepID=A0A6P5FIZ1_ANACO|nr:DNA-binding protein EMBP-1-like isoform X2 [Ananas comosus]